MIEFWCKDHPEANGRIPQHGEHAYCFLFPLADGKDLKIYCGEETLDHFRDFLGRMVIDEESERAGG